MKQASGKALTDIVVHSALSDGTRVCLRTITPADEAHFREGIAKMSADARYLRFFSPAPKLPDAVVARLAAVDGHDHIAWGAICVDCDGTPPIGAVHAVRHIQGDGTAGGRAGEYSVAVLDDFQGLGLARMLTAALLIDCCAEGLAVLDVHMLSTNAAARRLAKALCARPKGEGSGVAEYELDVADAIAALRADGTPQGVRDVFAQLMI